MGRENQYRDKALDLGRRLLHAFDTDHGLPNPVVNLRTCVLAFGHAMTRVTC